MLHKIAKTSVTSSVGALWGKERWTGLARLEDLLEAVRPAYGGPGWPAAIDCLRRSPGDAATIASLGRILAERGLFEEPIYVDVEDRAVGNGMHRIAASVLSGVPRILVTNHEHDDVELHLIHVDYRLAAIVWPPSGEDAFSDPVMNFAGDWLRSFPLPDGTWVTTDRLFGTGDVVEMTYYCAARHAEMLIETLRARCAQHGAYIEILDVRCVIEGVPET